MTTNRPTSPRDAVTVRSLVASAWRTAPRVLRLLALWMWAAATAAAAAALAADATGWWGDLPFATNLVSDAISAAVALPIALLVVRQLAAYQAEAASRPRLERQVRIARSLLATQVQAARGRIDRMERDVTAATNDFLRAGGELQNATTGNGAAVARADEAAQVIWSLLDASQWAILERAVAPVRSRCRLLHNALAERDSEDEIVRLDELLSDLESAMSHHKWVMETGRTLFGHRAAHTAITERRISDLRNAAIDHAKSYDRLLEACDRLRLLALDESPPDVML